MAARRMRPPPGGGGGGAAAARTRAALLVCGALLALWWLAFGPPPLDRAPADTSGDAGPTQPAVRAAAGGAAAAAAAAAAGGAEARAAAPAGPAGPTPVDASALRGRREVIGGAEVVWQKPDKPTGAAAARPPPAAHKGAAMCFSPAARASRCTQVWRATAHRAQSQPPRRRALGRARLRARGNGLVPPGPGLRQLHRAARGA